jgi:hypothetical protein
MAPLAAAARSQQVGGAGAATAQGPGLTLVQQRVCCHMAHCTQQPCQQASAAARVLPYGSLHQQPCQQGDACTHRASALRRPAHALHTQPCMPALPAAQLSPTNQHCHPPAEGRKAPRNACCHHTPRMLPSHAPPCRPLQMPPCWPSRTSTVAAREAAAPAWRAPHVWTGRGRAVRLTPPAPTLPASARTSGTGSASRAAPSPPLAPPGGSQQAARGG